MYVSLSPHLPKLPPAGICSMLASVSTKCFDIKKRNFNGQLEDPKHVVISFSGQCSHMFTIKLKYPRS